MNHVMNLQAWTCVELFAGDGNVGKSTKYGLVATAQLDIRYGGQVAQRNAFDLGHAAGLPLLPQHFGAARLDAQSHKKHAIKAGDLGASEHFASRFFLSACSGVYELQCDEHRNLEEVSLYSVWGHNPATCSSHLFAFFCCFFFSIPSC